MLLLEIEVTRLFSVLFFYHFSFFAISLVMSGLVVGGIIAGRWDARGMPWPAYEKRLAMLAAFFSFALAAAMLVISVLARPDIVGMPSLSAVAGYAVVFLPGLVAAGAFLALAFAREKTWISRLYAWDLLAAGAGCLAAIWVLRTFQGPALLLVPTLLAAVAAMVLGVGWSTRGVGFALVELCLVLGVVNHAMGQQVLRLRATPDTTPIYERWNEHSRIQVMEYGPGSRGIIIDRSAMTVIPFIPARPDGKPVEPSPAWKWGTQYQAYGVGRPLQNVAIIGVGGGPDLLPPLAYGARSVDGYELNQINIDLLTKEMRDFNAITSRPDVKLIHAEARVGISHSHKTYDVIQASLIDTWAATASGGFVLSENNLYTREAWASFLEHLTPTGILTMTRWLLPDSPAEAYRVVSLAAAALTDAGIARPADHLMLIAGTRAAVPTTATVLVSKTAFTPQEIERMKAKSDAEGTAIMAAPGIPPSDPVIAALLDNRTREQAVAESKYDISPPTDMKPYFFLQIRPRDLWQLKGTTFGGVTEITFNGVRVMVILAGCSFLLVLLVVGLTLFSLPGAAPQAGARRRFRTMIVYFLGLGLGYIFVQLALHQRLITVLGHPTFAFSVVLFCMLLGTGVGASLSSRLFPSGSCQRAALVIVGTLSVLWLLFPWLGALERLPSEGLRIFVIGALVSGVGFVLGFAFPLGVQQVAPTGEWAVQKLWAINGAASIAASILAAVAGLTFGSAGVLGFGVLAYAVAWLAAFLAERGSPVAPGPDLVNPAP